MKSNIAGITNYNNGELVIDATGLTFSFANSTKYNIPAGVTVNEHTFSQQLIEYLMRYLQLKVMAKK